MFPVRKEVFGDKPLGSTKGREFEATVQQDQRFQTGHGPVCRCHELNKAIERRRHFLFKIEAINCLLKCL